MHSNLNIFIKKNKELKENCIFIVLRKPKRKW